MANTVELTELGKQSLKRIAARNVLRELEAKKPESTDFWVIAEYENKWTEAYRNWFNEIEIEVAMEKAVKEAIANSTKIVSFTKHQTKNFTIAKFYTQAWAS